MVGEVLESKNPSVDDQ
ncbi:hypothetical protein CEXT_600271, partial [Caerostris extrusa]